MALSASIAISLLAIFTLSEANHCSRYCLPGLGCWPTDEEITNLGTSINGSIFRPVDNAYQMMFHMDNKLFSKQGPAIMALVLNKFDIQKCMNFARNHNLRVTIFSAGHDFQGKSTAVGSFQINLSRMQSIETNLTDSRSPTGASMTADAGTTWMRVHQAADKVGRLPVGTFGQPVALGGSITGGGYGYATRMYGLASDNVVSIEMVLVDGRTAYCTESATIITNSDGSTESVPFGDLYNAVLGGGGGTFGVVVKFTIVLHPAPQHVIGFYASFNISSSKADAEEVFSHLFRIYRILPVEWSGGFLVRPDTTVFAFNAYLQYGDDADLSGVRPIETMHRNLQWSAYRNFSSLWDLVKTTQELSGYRMYLVNTLIQGNSDLVMTAHDIVDLLTRHDRNLAIGSCTALNIGGNVKRIPSSLNSISGEFRSADFALSCGIGWTEASLDSTILAQGKNLTLQFIKDGRGAYNNEASTDTPDWQQNFWGSKYDSLLTAKKRWDPENFLYCHQCVGSEFGPRYQPPADTRDNSNLPHGTPLIG